MRFVTRSDIEAPADRVFAALADADRWERDALRRGARVARRDGPGPLRAGSAWDCAFDLRGRRREATLRLTRLEPPQRIDLRATGRAYDATVEVELVPLSPRRTRVITRSDVRAVTLAARILLQSARVARARIAARLQARADQVFAEVASRCR